MPTNDYSKNIVYLSKEQYQELITNETLTVNDQIITYNDNDIYVTPQAEPITDVKINGTSIGSNGVANIPLASLNSPGLIKGGINNAIVAYNGILTFNYATSAINKTGTSNTNPVVPMTAHSAAFYGLSKVAGVDLANETVTLGTYPDTSKAAIQNMLGITNLLSTEESSTATVAHALNSTFMMDGKLHRATAAIAIGDAVEVGTNCEVVKADEVFVKNTDYPVYGKPGVVLIDNNLGIDLNYGKTLKIHMATDGLIKAGNDVFNPIVSNNQHKSIFYGLSKLAGVDLANETVTLGTYPETSKTAIRSLIGAAAASDLLNKEDKTVIVTITGTWNQNETVYTADKTFAQIIAAIEAGKTVIATTESYGWHTHYKLTEYGIEANYPENSFVLFSYTGGQVSTWIRINYDNTIEYQNTILSTLQNIAINGTPVVTNNSIANIPAASADTFGVVKVGANGITLSSSNVLTPQIAIESDIKTGTTTSRLQIPANQHIAAFYGLAKAAGDTTQSVSTNAVGTYTDEAKAAIQTMLGVPGDIQVNGVSIVSNGVANIPAATNNSLGVIRPNTAGGLEIVGNNLLQINGAPSAEIKNGLQGNKAIVPLRQHESVFYGLAKAAGDATQSASSNAVGTYTAEAKAAIHTMLGIDPASIAAQVDIPLVETVSGTTPTITGQPNVRYVCGEVSTITITPPASGSVDVIFESGSTATTMTVPSTVKWLAWFDATTLEADTTYEILITDGIYGSVMTWAT